MLTRGGKLRSRSSISSSSPHPNPTRHDDDNDDDPDSNDHDVLKNRSHESVAAITAMMATGEPPPPALGDLCF